MKSGSHIAVTQEVVFPCSCLLRFKAMFDGNVMQMQHSCVCVCVGARTHARTEVICVCSVFCMLIIFEMFEVNK